MSTLDFVVAGIGFLTLLLVAWMAKYIHEERVMLARFDGRNSGVESERKRCQQAKADGYKIRKLESEMDELKSGTHSPPAVVVARSSEVTLAEPPTKESTTGAGQPSARVELEELGWTPLLTSCAPNAAQQIVVTGLADGGRLFEERGVWYARYLSQSGGIAELSNGVDGRLTLDLDGTALWMPLERWRSFGRQERSRQLLAQVNEQATTFNLALGTPLAQTANNAASNGSRARKKKA